MSSILGSLKLVSAKRNTRIDPVLARRHKVIEKVREQIALATALKSGNVFTAKRLRRVRDEETGVTQVIAVTKKVKEWWFTSGDKVCVQLRYGTKVVPLSAKGDKNSIEVRDADEMLDVLNKLEEAIANGELDAQLQSTSELTRSKLKK